MELRSNTHRDYKMSLVSLGLYEEGMNLNEMRQVMQALEESELESETVFFESDMERALKESELDYVQMHRDAHSSTMIKHSMPDHNFNIVKPQNTPAHHFPNSDASPFSSPEIVSKKIIVEAIVHHELNWSPPSPKRKQAQNKNMNSDYNNSNLEKRKVVENASVKCDVKRLRLPITSSPKSCSCDSGIYSVYSSGDAGDVTEDYRSEPSF
ncbi:uncharacterized protein LOC129248092 [Anastrepha obliqua]|uniref:uncharacterized protein LOC129248092 n=1 Tax=Anastrepha obliqua TaxID=95512 RepID=UPI002409F9DC|nr:uncharacterized protein LOC129248092 [Anastrepha obliqua]